MERLWERIKRLNVLPGRYKGMALGVLVWVFIEFFGFFPTLLLAALMVIGFAVGRIFDRPHEWEEWVKRLLQSDPYE
ncbi:DUF2273 domain-containing protein [Ferroacidibacillus organovorans]|uniref:DUF2273 domain-containing protein n=1 Tax=Ferroacidibacillus organovorans TaxID=1765683 RepID=A0A124IWA3_9BACL|nr:DUF2273 domain-containing protein [Ferroacidibacillus organovorans]KUO96785.1 hypothetical protein ATW55_08160 [Ferroacidibacillus organovorans]